MKVSVVKNAGTYPTRFVVVNAWQTGEGSTTTSGNAILLSGELGAETGEEVA